MIEKIIGGIILTSLLSSKCVLINGDHDRMVRQRMVTMDLISYLCQ